MISSLSQEMVRLKAAMNNKCKDLFEAVLEKDVRIQELEDQNETLENRLSDLSSSKNLLIDESEYNHVMTLNSAMQSNLRSQLTRINELEDSNKKLTLKSKYRQVSSS